MRQHEVLPDGLKRCKTCRDALPVDQFWKHPGTFDKLYPQCKGCYRRERGMIAKPVFDAPPEGYKRCGRCKSVLPSTTEFYAFNKGRGRLQSYCRKCFSQYTNQWHKAHPEPRRRRNRALYTKYKFRHSQYLFNWRRKNPQSIKAYSETRRAKKKASVASYTYREWLACLDYFDCKCAVCERPAGLWHTISQDHWIPLSKGGGHQSDNIVPLCHGVNG